jgi:intraflagellar transport protein 172
LFKLCQAGPTPFEMELFSSHLLSLLIKSKDSMELKPICAKIAISLLRYTHLIRPDQAFYEAGFYSKLAGMSNMAFVCWNRFLDMSDAIEQGSRLEDNADFALTDIPFDIELPKENLPEKLREQVRDWVLAVSLDQKVNQEIDYRQCRECNAQIYAASLVCHNCKKTEIPCCVTGYPIINGVECTQCHKQANRDDWNAYVSVKKTCPWCEAPQNPIYFV